MTLQVCARFFQTFASFRNILFYLHERTTALLETLVTNYLNATINSGFLTSLVTVGQSAMQKN